MPDIRFSEAERQLLLVLVTEAWARINADPEMQPQITECVDLIRKLSGTDTVLLARKP